MQNLIKIYHAAQETKNTSTDQKPRHRFAYQSRDNVKVYKFAKFDPNIPCGSFLLTDHDRPDWCSAKPRPSKKAVTNVSG